MLPVQIGMTASRKDDLRDDNNDGVPDVQQLEAKELVTRKLGVFLKATDPHAVNEAMLGLSSGAVEGPALQIGPFLQLLLSTSQAQRLAWVSRFLPDLRGACAFCHSCYAGQHPSHSPAMPNKLLQLHSLPKSLTLCWAEDLPRRW